MGEHAQLAEAYKRAMLARFGHSTWEVERARLVKEKREAEEREAQRAADLAEAERQRQEAIDESKKLAPGVAIPPELPVITYDPVHGSLVKFAGDKAAAERLLGVPIQE